jgi:DNA-3-methyladenine glycosylase II
MALYCERGRLNAVPPFDFSKTLSFLSAFKPIHDEQIISKQTFTKAVSIQGRPVVFQVTSVGTVDAPELEYTLYAAQPIAEEIKMAAVDRIRFFLSLDDDLRPFYELGRKDAIFAPVMEQLYGYHQLKFLTPFENACWAVLSQRNPMNMSQKMKRAITERYGPQLKVEGILYRAFPEAPELAAADPDTLRQTVRNERKAEQVANVARAFSKADEHFLRTAPYDEVEAWLLGIKGIGAWSANFIMLRGLGRMDKVPDSEKRLLEVIEQRYGPGQRANLAEVAAPYGPWQGYWAHYLRVGG